MQCHRMHGNVGWGRKQLDLPKRLANMAARSYGMAVGSILIPLSRGPTP